MHALELAGPGWRGRAELSPWSWLGALMVLGLSTRALLFWTYDLQTYPDTGTYLTAARDLFSGGPWLGQGRRTPGYPLLIALVGESHSGLYVVNLAAGLVTSALLFAIAFMLTGRPALAFVAGAAHELNLQQLFLQAAMATETVSTATVAGVVALAMLAFRQLRAGRRPWGLLVALGVLCGYSLLVRPQFVFLVGLLPLMAVYAVSGLRLPDRVAIGSALALAVPALALVLGWSSLVQAKAGPFALSTQAGFGLMNHTVDYIELAPARYATVNEILLRTREARIADFGHSGNTVWVAWPEIQRATGWSLPTASSEFQSLSAELFRQHPMKYAGSVAQAWVQFWTVPIMWDLDGYAGPLVRTALEAVWWVEHKMLRLVNLVFVALAIGVAWPALRRRLDWDMPMTLITATVLASSLIQALADKNAGSRYHMTTQSLALLFVMVAAARWWSTRPGRASQGA